MGTRYFLRIAHLLSGEVKGSAEGFISLRAVGMSGATYSSRMMLLPFGTSFGLSTLPYPALDQFRVFAHGRVSRQPTSPSSLSLPTDLLLTLSCRPSLNFFLGYSLFHPLQH